MGALDRNVEFQLTFGDMALTALVVRYLRQPGMIFSGGEIDIVMTASAGSAARVGQVLIAGVAFQVAGRTVTDIGREDNRRKIVDGLLIADDYIGFAGHDAGQA